MARSIDLNADMGEYSSPESAQNEAALMGLITSCSIACGGHTGDAQTMSRTVQLAKTNAVAIGAHPSYPDREGFGRRTIDIDPEALAASLRTQIDRLLEILDSEGVTLRHIKPHGALYNDAARDEPLANMIVAQARGAAILGPPGSALETAARSAGATFLAEGFVDRLYCKDGSLTPRAMPGAVIADVETRALQATAIARGAEFPAADGALRLHAHTLCIHSDSPGALDTARAVREALRSAGVGVAAFSAPAPCPQ